MIWKRNVTDVEVIDWIRRSQRNRMRKAAGPIGIGVACVIGSVWGVFYVKSMMADALRIPPEVQASVPSILNDSSFFVGVAVGCALYKLFFFGFWGIIIGLAKVIPDRRNSLLLESWDKLHPQPADATSVSP